MAKFAILLERKIGGFRTTIRRSIECSINLCNTHDMHIYTQLNFRGFEPRVVVEVSTLDCFRDDGKVDTKFIIGEVVTF